jgi:hypothetical protein
MAPIAASKIKCFIVISFGAADASSCSGTGVTALAFHSM